MTSVPGRLARVAAAAAVAAVGLPTAPPAAAVTPPPVDLALLPQPRPAAPPQATAQREQCAASSAAADVPRRGYRETMDLATVWNLARGAGQTVAVIDTGVARHRLLPHLVPGGDYVSSGDGTQDCDGHGTIVAGIIGATPEGIGADGFGGIAPDAGIMAIRQSSNNFGVAGDPGAVGFGDVDTLALAVRNAADAGATVINVSSVACLDADAKLDDRALGAALAYAVDVKNVVVVAAAGNVGGPGQCPAQNPPADPRHPGQPDWAGVRVVASPAWYDQYVLTVGSVAPDGTPSAFSLAGPWVDVAAPGEAVVSLNSGGEGLVDSLAAGGTRMPISGTSYAAPVVTAVVALVRSRSPQLTARQVMQRIEDTARRPAGGWDPAVGGGLVDALAAVSGSTAPSSRPGGAARRSVPIARAAAPEDGARRMAVRWGSACVGIAAAAVAVSAVAARLRRRP